MALQIALPMASLMACPMALPMACLTAYSTNVESSEVLSQGYPIQRECHT